MQNILLVMMDQLRYDALGFMQTFPVRTPNLDRLAAGGTVFANAYCANPVCVPARASLMTGVYSYDHGVYYNDQNWPEAMDTYAGRLADNGYYTTCIGKTHFLPKGRHAGFQKLIPMDMHRRYLAERGLFKPGHKGKVTDGDHLNADYPLQPTHVPLEHYRPVYLTNRALHELDRIAARRECDAEGCEPFMMKLSYALPHSPCNCPEPYFSMYENADLPPPVASEGEVARFPAQLRRWYEIWSQLEEERARRNRAHYLGCVSLLDEQIGRVLEKLQSLNILDNTLIVVTSDHGDHLCDHHLQQKGFFYDCSAKVPFIFSGPGVPAGKTVTELVSHVDMFPTLTDYCDLALERHRGPHGQLIYPDTHERDAISLLPYFAGDEPVWPDRVVVSENAVQGQHFMLRQGDLKVNYYLNRDRANEWEVYDLAADPDELDSHGAEMSADQLSPAMRAVFDRVLRRSGRHAGEHYYFQDKVRPMFT